MAAINAAMEALNKAQHAAAESLYKNAQVGGGGGEQGGGASDGGQASSEPLGEKQGEVIDAEVVDEK